MRPPKYIKQILTGLKDKIDNNTVTVGYPTSSNEQIIQTENQQGNNGPEPRSRPTGTNGHRKNVPPIALEYTFFSSTRRTPSRMDPTIGHITSFIKLRKTEIIPSILSSYNSI